MGGFQYIATYQSSCTRKYAAPVVALQFFPTAEGYVANNAGVYSYVYQYKDHLGNVRLSYSDTNNDGLITSSEIIAENNYYPFGLIQKGYNNVFNSTNPALNYKYNGKELQDELGLNMYDYGARNYDPARAGWSNIDPLAEKMRRWSPYNYGFDDPMRFTDPDGMGPEDIVVLNAPEGAHGAGHMAMLIQNKNGTWSLFSKNGTTKNGGTFGPNDKIPDKGSGSFKSPEDFMKSKLNPVDKETGKREYEEGYSIKTTEKEDRAAEKGALKELSKDYNVLGSNCAKTVQSGLKAAGKEDGSPSALSTAAAVVAGAAVAGPVGAAAAATANEKTPRIIYERIKDQNEGKVIK